MLSIEVHSDSIVGLHKFLKFLLKAVVLVIQVGHVPVKSINLTLQIELVLHHLIRVLLQSIQFVTDRLFILDSFIMRNLQLLKFHALILALHVLVLIGFKELALRCLVLLILLFKVAELAIQFIECVFEVLNLLDGVLSFVVRPNYSILLLLEHVGNGGDAMLVVIELGVQHVQPLLLSVDVLVKVEGNVPEASQLVVMSGGDVFLFSNKALLVLNILSMVQIGHVFLRARVPQVCQLIARNGDVLLRLHDYFEHADLLLLHLDILRLQLVQLADQNISFLAVLTDFVEAVTFKLLLFELHLFVLLLQVAELFLKCVVVFLLAP